MQKLVVLLGTNASGKSELAIRLAKDFRGEVVSADSRQVYRRLDLGSGKISAEQAASVPHHLIDVVDVSENYSLARYQVAAYRAIDQIAVREKLPFLVGGTGLYISAIVDGYQLADVPPNETLRAELERLALPDLVERLRSVDAEAAAHIDIRNPRRVIRAVELASAGFPSRVPQRKQPRYECLQLGLTWPREVLAQRVEKRLKDRLASGMLEEVSRLRSSGVPDSRLHSLGLEYRYIARYLRGEYRSLDELSRELGGAIRQFAKEQLTWFKRDRRIVWLDPFGDYCEQARNLIENWLKGEAEREK